MKMIASSRTWCSGIKRAMIMIAVTLMVLFACYAGTMSWRNWQLENRTAESKIIGKTPAEIISLLGPPQERAKNAWEPAGTEILLYTNGGSRACRINVVNGIAKSVERNSDH